MRTTSVDARYGRAIGSGLDSACRWPIRPLGHGPYHHSKKEVTVQQGGYGPISAEIRAGPGSWIESWIEGSAMEMSLRAAFKDADRRRHRMKGDNLWIPMLLR